ncbi:hypothetical protein HID58_094406 [Brassica napus]|uniref:Uncharacterized protein n=1 Tax=Brassica napus TaxID=3708 RepID=A0ABQ7X9S4_BRANA|nr:hypothetical protein HID58_094406 [Brassica napus]
MGLGAGEIGWNCKSLPTFGRGSPRSGSRGADLLIVDALYRVGGFCGGVGGRILRYPRRGKTDGPERLKLKQGGRERPTSGANWVGADLQVEGKD